VGGEGFAGGRAAMAKVFLDGQPQLADAGEDLEPGEQEPTACANGADGGGTGGEPADEVGGGQDPERA